MRVFSKNKIKVQINTKKNKPSIAIILAMFEILKKLPIHEIFSPPIKPLPIVIVRILKEADLSLSLEKV